eukprot:TRINITY_DN2572_c0_g1_i7.p2 TRINITY_DN2572_c0_g1~~TRINITY_DN2572_c0_g1_i7.p2  ORF type:complete len:153 (+),score=15.24 TRINITY_DN2572_c0_g1_i7:354-812(+)
MVKLLKDNKCHPIPKIITNKWMERQYDKKRLFRFSGGSLRIIDVINVQHQMVFNSLIDTVSTHTHIYILSLSLSLLLSPPCSYRDDRAQRVSCIDFSFGIFRRKILWSLHLTAKQCLEAIKDVLSIAGFFLSMLHATSALSSLSLLTSPCFP